MIERYIYAVTRKISKVDRNDVESELRELINEMLDNRMNGADATERDIREVLYELGHPNKLASKYRGNEKFIIGPELYDSYILILKIALITTIAVLSATFIVQTIINPLNILDFFVEYILAFFTTVIPMAVGWTTLAFIIIQYIQPKKLASLSFNKEWDPGKLPAIPEPNKQIKPSEVIIAIIINIILIVFLSFSHEHFGIWLFEDGQFIGAISFLNELAFPAILPFIVLMFSLLIVKELLKLIYEKWTYSLFVINAVTNTISIVILFLIKNKLWNENFIGELLAQGVVTEGSDSFNTITILWEQLTFWIIALSIVGLLIDIILSLFKTRRTKK